MRVLHAVTLHSPTHAFGGPVRVALNLSKGLRARGHEARIVALGDGFEGALPTEVEGVPAELFQARRFAPLGFSGITSPALLAGAGRLVRDADVVHVHLARDLVTLPFALAALRAGRPLVLQTHGMVDPSGRLLAKVLDALAVRRVLRGASAVLYLTEHERAALDEVAGPPGLERTTRLVNGVPAQPQGPGHPGGAPHILYAARLQARKRPRDFVAAVPEILRHHPDATFTIAGPDEGELAPVRALIEELGLKGTVSVPGSLSGPAMLDTLREATVYVLPAVDEPFPMSVLESLSVGTPVVITGSNGLAKDVSRAGAGRVVEGPEELAPAVRELLDPPAHHTAATAAAKLAAESFSMDAVVDTLLTVYDTAVERGAGAAGER
ncbi:glycosyltransferase [Streptomyces tsukubensis]|uniref:D-inositol 3-phosphate glycosyltransferase n=1 Tax=Streptomyces tsukubensis TaxID=83656 RepID=A0A1V4A2X3_9ACTN|nr:glycosyltransferase [Streptomyces tsukubensis]OON73476.1 glycosyl transferase [Streptomyces tsukubensis]QFR96732.1 glycosyltransferase [Streptomyces tsukubensis]